MLFYAPIDVNTQPRVSEGLPLIFHTEKGKRGSVAISQIQKHFGTKNAGASGLGEDGI